MFLDFYKLREQPFGETPDSRYLYLSPTHREALASMAYGIAAGRGFLALIADPGMGKTTLLFHLLDWLRKAARTAFLFQTQCGSRGLLRHLLGDLGIKADNRGSSWMQEQLKEVLITESGAGRRLVVFIDEAQNLRESVLETVRLLSDFENPRSKLIQIVLSGQTQLADKLARPELAQLRQRVSILSRLRPFTPPETEAYIRHRLMVAGSSGREVFSPEALAAIAEWSGGIPRNINNLSFNALSLGFALGKHEIDYAVVDEAAADLELNAVLRRHAEFNSSPGVPTAEPAPPQQEFADTGREDEGQGVVNAAPGQNHQPIPTTSRRVLRPRNIAMFVAAPFALLLVTAAGIISFPNGQPQQAVVEFAPPRAPAQPPTQATERASSSAAVAKRLPSRSRTPRKKSAASRRIAAQATLAPAAPLFRLRGEATDKQGPSDLSGVSSDAPSGPAVPSISGRSHPAHADARVKEPRVASKILPVYPPDAAESGIEGEVVIDAVVDEIGRPTRLEVVSGPALLRRAALDSAREWHYEPGYLDDKAVPVEMYILIDFRLRWDHEPRGEL